MTLSLDWSKLRCFLYSASTQECYTFINMAVPFIWLGHGWVDGEAGEAASS